MLEKYIKPLLHLGKYLMASIWAILAPIHATLSVVFLLIIIDFISGIIAAKRRKEPINSAGIKRTIIKIFVFEISLCLGFLAEHYIPGSLPFVNLIGGFISLTEMTSIIENMNELSGNTLLQALIKKLGQS